MAAPKKTKELTKKIKLQIQAGAANPAPPVGPALGQAGVNIMDFCKQFNEKTKGQQGPIPVVINVYKDRSFDFVTKMAPTSYLVMQAAKIKAGSKTPGLASSGTVKKAALMEVAKAKMPDLNAHDEQAAYRMVAGTARSMGLQIVE